MPRFDTRSVHVRFVVDKGAVGLGFVRVFRFPLSITFHQCSILILYILLLPE